MKKYIIFGIIFILILSVCGCSQKESGKNTASKSGAERSLYEHGTEMIALLDEMINNDDYRELYSNSEDILEVARQIGQGDYSEVYAVYKLTLPKDLSGVFAVMNGMNFNTMSEALQNNVEDRVYQSLANIVNAQRGVAYLATASTFTVEKTFVNTEITENCAYLYTFENGFPVLITFITGEDNTVAANGIFVMYENAHEEDEIKEILNMLMMYGVEFEQISK